MNRELLIEKGLLAISLSFLIIILLLIAFIASEALPILNEYGFLKFILGFVWGPDSGKFGVFPMIIGSAYVTGLSLIIAIPLALSCAIYLEEIASKRISKIFKPIIQTLAGIPSVIYGFFGLTFLCPIIREIFHGSGFSVLSASLVLSVMILPTIISVSQDALKSVPHQLKEASIGMGSTQWQTIKNIIIPTALPGIATAVILAMGRAIGETLAVLMLAGNVSAIPSSIFDSARTLTSGIALEMGYATGIHYNALFATAVILFIIILALIAISNHISKKWGCRY